MATGRLTEDEIKIEAEVLDAERCQFKVDRPVIPMGGSLQFSSREKAAGTPLAEKLFGIGGIATVLITGNTVTVSRGGSGDWASLGKEIGKTIRTYLVEESDLISSAVSEKSGHAGSMEEQIKEKVQHVLTTKVNPGIASHGGVIQLLDVKGTTIYIQMGGGCQGCGMASVTLKQGIEREIKQYVPEVTEILDTTDHASGTNPFYASSDK